MKYTLGLLEHSALLVILLDGSKDFFNNGASSSSDLFIPLQCFGELSKKV